MITSSDWIAPEDYKVYCFNGMPKYTMVCVGREKGGHPKFYFFDNEWNLARINKDSINAPADFHMDKPQCLQKMLVSASKLSKPFPFVRADFYIVQDKVYFGELTFTPSGGLDANIPSEMDEMFGNMIDLKYNGQKMLRSSKNEKNRFSNQP